MSYSCTGNNRFFLCVLLFLLCTQPVSTTPDLISWYYPPLTINKKYLIGGAGVAGLFIVYYLFFMKNNSKSDEKKGNPNFKGHSVVSDKNNNPIVLVPKKEGITIVNNIAVPTVDKKDSDNVDQTQTVPGQPIVEPNKLDKEDTLDKILDDTLNDLSEIDQTSNAQTIVVPNKTKDTPENLELDQILNDASNDLSKIDDQTDDENNTKPKSFHDGKKSTSNKDEQKNLDVNEKWENMVQNFNYFMPEHVKKLACSPERIDLYGSDKTRAKEFIVNRASRSCTFVENTFCLLMDNFIRHKGLFGTDIEKKFYKSYLSGFSKDNSRRELIKRLLTCRPKNSTKSDNEKELSSFISDDEVKLSSYISVYCTTLALNQGGQFNRDEVAVGNEHESSEIGVTALVVPCFEKMRCFDSQDIIIDPEQNTLKNGYGLDPEKFNENKLIYIWEKFFGVNLPTYEEAKEEINKGFTDDYLPLYSNHSEKDIIFFNIRVYKIRIKYIVKSFLHRVYAKHRNTEKKVYLSVVPLDKGTEEKIVWLGHEYKPTNINLSSLRQKIQIEAYQTALRELIKENKDFLKNITDIDFTYFGLKTGDFEYSFEQYDYLEKFIQDNTNMNKGSKYTNARTYLVQIDKNNTVFFHLSQRSPFAKLKGNDSGKYRECTYPWKVNSFVGSELWDTLSPLSSMAYATQPSIAALLNPKINQYVLETMCMVKS